MSTSTNTPTIREHEQLRQRIDAVPVDTLAVDAVDLAKLLAVSESTIRRWTASGTMPSVLIGGVRIYPLAEIRTWLSKLVSQQCTATPVNANGHGNNPVAATL
ncbi:MAG: helix-turn-helix domain-containing protein [Pirellulales bacterium]|nr:helix-turn-helix domain-containing protein [Pirellulales bacterium]